MAMTPGEQSAYRRAYGRRYNAIRKRAYEHARKIAKIAKGLRARLTDTDSEKVCSRCARWTRGGSSTVWGICRADFEWDVEPRMWAAPQDWKRGDIPLEIITEENFGCVNWTKP